jgi:hypothetical protein
MAIHFEDKIFSNHKNLASKPNFPRIMLLPLQQTKLGYGKIIDRPEGR